jgi:hypothetical protein
MEEYKVIETTGGQKFYYGKSVYGDRHYCGFRVVLKDEHGVILLLLCTNNDMEIKFQEYDEIVNYLISYGYDIVEDDDYDEEYE